MSSIGDIIEILESFRDQAEKMKATSYRMYDDVDGSPDFPDRINRQRMTDHLWWLHSAAEDVSCEAEYAIKVARTTLGEDDQ